MTQKTPATSGRSRSIAAYQRSWIVAIAIIAFFLYGRRQLSDWTMDIIVFMAYLISVVILVYYSLRVLMAQRQHADTPVGATTLIRVVPAVFLYLGLAVVVVCVSYGIAMLSNMTWEPNHVIDSIGNMMIDKSSVAQTYYGYSFFAGIAALFLMWLAAFQVRMSGSVFEYWSFGGGYKSMKMSDIENAYARADFSRSWSRRGRPPLSLVIKPLPGLGIKTIYMNMKMFRKKDLQRIYTRLGAKMTDGSDEQQ